MTKATGTYSYRNIWRVAYPILISLVMEQMIGLTDTAFLGRVGEVELGASAIAIIYYMVLFMIGFGFSLGAQIIIGRRNGEGNFLATGKIFWTGLYFVLGLAGGLIVLSEIFSPWLMGLMVSSEAIYDAALSYVRWRLPGMAFAFVTTMFRAFYVGTTQTKTLTLNSIVMVLANVLFNWVLIFGHLGFEAMGALGAGVATLIARIAQCVIMVAYFFYTPKFREYTQQLFNLTRLNIKAMIETMKVGLPIAFQMFMEASAFALAGVLVLAFGAHSVSAYQIGTNMMNVTFMIVIAIGSATTILTSHIYGRRNFGKLRHTVYASYQLGLLWNITIAILYIIFRNQIPTLFTSNQETIELTARMLIFIALFQVSDCLQAISISILRGLQDVKAIMPIVFVSYVVFNIPVGYLLAFKTELESIGLIIGFIVGLSICAVLTIRRVRRNINRLERSGGN